MATLFCAAKERSNDWLSRLIGIFKPPDSFSDANGILGDTGYKWSERVASVLRERRYYVFQNLLSEELCDRLLQYATTHECKIRPIDGGGRENQVPENQRLQIRLLTIRRLYLWRMKYGIYRMGSF